MRVLVLTFYFPPDLAAGSFRAAAFVDALERALPSASRIDVYTTFPNRYSSHQASAEKVERWRRVCVRRIPLPDHRSGLVDQSRAFARFARSVIGGTRRSQYDLVFATSSRLLTAALGAYCARRLRARLFLDLRDIFTDTMESMFPRHVSRLLLPPFNRIERYAVETADAVNLVSPAFRSHFAERYPGKTFSVVPNGVDPLFDQPIPSGEANAAGKPKRVLYAGNIGQGQGLHRILPELAQRCGRDYEFLVRGDGGTRPLLEQRLRENAVDNVFLHDPVPREHLKELYDSADILFLHLNDWRAFHRVLPSKIFEYAATGKPILAGVSGYAAQFLRDEVANVRIFEPCDVSGALAALEALEAGVTDRSDFIAKYRRDDLMDDLVQHVLAIMDYEAG